ncbi:PREDICTED: thioredoxin H2-like isoform X1 [Tarenaya hassleriana]|uniref:thioredoxin H2-like isoform X1 n=1 Tax=Tarenaya hassleriana TaxID=28532 RepID=UPI00053CA23A|nr:PREDICTED: thioredoxin H2-like isoform X1 [Tarenaya hassleriana]
MGGILSSFLGGAASESETGSESDRVSKFSSSARWQLYFNEIKESSKLLVIDFTASWCGPCKMMAPVFQGLAEKFTDVEFVKIDVDEVPDVAREFGVQAMPTFVLVKRGREVDRVVGAKKDELERKISHHRP